MNKYSYSVILIFGLSLTLLSQTKFVKDTLYLDENKNEITQKLFHKKISSVVFYSRTYEINNMVINKVSYQYYFGKISSQKRNEIQALLNSQTNLNIKNDENILIKYYDTLQGFEAQKRKRKAHIKSYKGNFIVVNNDTIDKHKPFTLEQYEKSKVKYQSNLAKCAKKLSKRKNTIVIQIYNFNNNYELNKKELTWLKDPGIFKENFFINAYESNLLIIKPNGDFFMKYSHLKNVDLFELLETGNWSQYILDWEKSIKTNSSLGYGIIKSLNSINNSSHPKHCY